MTAGTELIFTLKCSCGKTPNAYNVEGLCSFRKHLMECKTAEHEPLTYFWLYTIGEIIREWRLFA
ncbi:hypothetical protein [Candidatus Nitrososphaera gargensis]|nr:hypothetical protein [Candidatus Nitrososphaera gargensis]